MNDNTLCLQATAHFDVKPKNLVMNWLLLRTIGRLLRLGQRTYDVFKTQLYDRHLYLSKSKVGSSKHIQKMFIFGDVSRFNIRFAANFDGDNYDQVCASRSSNSFYGVCFIYTRPTC